MECSHYHNVEMYFPRASRIAKNSLYLNENKIDNLLERKGCCGPGVEGNSREVEAKFHTIPLNFKIDLRPLYLREQKTQNFRSPIIPANPDSEGPRRVKRACLFCAADPPFGSCTAARDS